MKSNKWVLLITIFVFGLSLIIGFFTALYVKSSIGDNLFALSFHNDNAAFGNKDIEFLTRGNYSFTFAAKLEATGATETIASQVEVVGTNADFFSINKLNVVSGSFFNDIHEKKLSNVAVLNIAAAWYFWGSINCVGNRICINGKPYQVIGISENDFPHDGDKLIYVPYNNMEEYQTESGIYEILIAADGISHLDPLIKNMGYMPEDIQITDMEQYKDIMMQRVRIIVFLVGLYRIACCFKSGLNHTRDLVQEIKGFYGDNYVTDIHLLLKKKSILFKFCLLAGNVMFVFLVINIIKFKIHLPYYFFSLNNINYSVLEDLLSFFMQPYISVSFLRYMNDLNAVSNLMFFVSVLSGTVVLLRRRA